MGLLDNAILVPFSEATDEQLRRELAEAEESGARCDAQGTPWHSWHRRAATIRSLLAARSRKGADDLCSPGCADDASHCGDGHCIDRDGPL